MEKAYKQFILEAIENCMDEALLDLVWKLLAASAGAPDPAGPTIQEVENNDNDQRDTEQHRTLTVQVLQGTKHPAPDSAGVGNRRKKLPRVCGGADSLSRAA